jgi:HlyD family secretion protein
LKIALIVLMVLLGVVIAGALVAGPQLQDALSSLKPAPPTTKVRVETAALRKLVETVKAPGKIEPHTKVDISAEVSSRIEEMPFDVGDVVKKGDMVVKLDDRDLQASVNSATARVQGEEARLQSEQARLAGLIAMLNMLKVDLERRQTLARTGDVAMRDLDTLLADVANQEAQVEATKFTIQTIEASRASAKADVDQMQQRLDKTVIRSPMDGMLIARNAEIGEVVLVGTMNNPGTVIITIADLSRMLVKAEVAETDIAKIADDQTATVHINAYRDEAFSGTVTQIAEQRTENELNSTGYFEAEIEIDLRGRQIRSGGLANVDIAIAQHDGVAIESQAIVDRNVENLPDEVKRDNPLVDRSRKTCSVVYRLVDGKATCTPVKRGASDDTHSLVLEGLKEGEVVVIGPYKALEQIKHGDLLSIDEGRGEAPRADDEKSSVEIDID